MASGIGTDATLDGFHRWDGKAEWVGGRIVPLKPTGRRPNLIAGPIFRSLAAHVEALGLGEAYTDPMGFAVPELSSGRRTFSPDVSFSEGPPAFAVEVCGEGDYGPAAESEMSVKRADDFIGAGFARGRRFGEGHATHHPPVESARTARPGLRSTGNPATRPITPKVHGEAVAALGED